MLMVCILYFMITVVGNFITVFLILWEKYARHDTF